MTLHTDTIPDSSFTALVTRLLDRLDSPDGDWVIVAWSDSPSVGDESAQADPIAERQLILRGVAGDDEALDVLVRREWYWVFRSVCRAEPDLSVAEELTQEVFTRAIAELQRVADDGGSFRSFVQAIAERVMAGHATEEPGPRAEVLTLTAEHRQMLVDALDTLPRRRQELLRLRLLDGWTTTEIGVDCGRPADSVRHLQREALLACRAGPGRGAA